MILELNDKYYVRGLQKYDLDGNYPGWFEDQDVCRFNSHGKFFKTREYFAEYILQLNNSDSVVWAICNVDDGHIGNVSLQHISFIDRTAEFAIIMGDKRHWGKGVASLAGVKLVDHGFRKLNLERISCGTAATNLGMKRLAQVMGMTLEGTRRKQHFLEGERVDMLEYGILRDEFMESNI